MALFACSFDAASPLAPWTTATGVSIVVGRNANGCSIPNASGFLVVNGSFGATCTAGLAFKPNSFVNQVCTLSDSSGQVGAPSAKIVNSGDGRMSITVGAGTIGTATSGNFDGFVQNIGIWNYYELSVDIVLILTPVDGTHSNVSITITATAFVNNNQIGTITQGFAAANVLNSLITLGLINNLSIQQNFCIVDDVYVDTARIGDCFVASDDTTVTVETSAPDITQTLYEVGLVDPLAAPDITQSLYEVGLAPTTITIACPVLNLATLGVTYSSFVVVGGDFPPDVFSITAGALPPGLTLNTVTGEISGIPTTVGFYTYTVHVVDSHGQIASIECSIQVSAVQPPAVKAPTRCPLNIEDLDVISLACPVLGSPAVASVPYSKQMVVSGGIAPLSFVLTIGPLPPGLVLNLTTGFITGTPTTQGLYPFTVQVIDSSGQSAFVSCSISIVGSSPSQLFVTCPLSGAANVDEPYSGALIGSGGTGPYTFSVVLGALPPGLTLTAATISGTPTTAGTYNYTVRVTDSLSATSDSPCQIIVGPPIPPPPPSNTPAITTLTVPGGTVGFFYSFQLNATGSTPITWTATGLPSGMSVSTHGVLGGVPIGAGTSNITVTAHNAFGDSTPIVFSLVIASGGVAPTMTSTSPLPDGSVGIPYTFTFTASGTSPITFFALVPSVGSPIMSLDGPTGVLTWNNPVAGVYTLQVEANNGAGSTGFIPFSLTISAIPVPPTPPPVP